LHKTEVLTLLLCAFAALLHGLSGFGFPMVSTAALSMFYSLQTAVAMVIIPCIILNLSLLQAGKNHSFFQNILHYLKQYWGLIGSSLIGSFIGVGLLLYVNEGYLKLIMGSVILLYVLDQFRSQPFQVSRSFKNMLIFGFLAGVIGGATNAMAPFLMMYLLSTRHDKTDVVMIPCQQINSTFAAVPNTLHLSTFTNLSVDWCNHFIFIICLSRRKNPF